MVQRELNEVEILPETPVKDNYYLFNNRLYYYDGTSFILISSSGKLLINIFKNNANYLDYLINTAETNSNKAKNINILEDVDYNG